MKLPTLTNFQFSIFNFQSIFKNLIIIFLATCYLLLATTPVIAQSANPGLETNTNPDVPKNLHSWTQNVMVEVMAAMMCQIAGVDPINPKQQCLGVDPKTNKIGFVENGGGAIAVMGNLIAMTYTSPLHTGDYFTYLAQNFGITKTAYAQTTGTGFNSIKPLLGLWVAFRNIVYMLFVAVFVLVGFGIMLRINIDPRTVMAISNQLPKIIITILLVTFSFAISGLIIDLMWTSIYVTYGVIADAKITKIENGKPKVIDLSNLNPTNMAGKTAISASGGTFNTLGIASDLAGSTKNVIQNMLGIDPTWGKYDNSASGFEKLFKNVGGVFGITPGMLSSGGFLNWAITIISGTAAVTYAEKVANIVGSWFTIPAGSVTSWPVGIGVYMTLQYTLREVIPWLIPFIIILTALLFALFRIWFQLIIAYVTILVDIVFAPFWIVAGLIPGSPIDFGAWLRDMLANLSAFPVTIGMFLLGKVFIETFNGATGPFIPPLVGNFANTNLFGSIIGLGILLMTPQAVTMMKDLFKSPTFKHTAAISQAIGVGTGMTNLPSHAQSIGNSLFGLSHFPGAKHIPFVGRFIPGGGTPQN